MILVSLVGARLAPSDLKTKPSNPSKCRGILKNTLFLNRESERIYGLSLGSSKPPSPDSGTKRLALQAYIYATLSQQLPDARSHLKRTWTNSNGVSSGHDLITCDQVEPLVSWLYKSPTMHKGETYELPHTTAFSECYRAPRFQSAAPLRHCYFPVSAMRLAIIARSMSRACVTEQRTPKHSQIIGCLKT